MSGEYCRPYTQKPGKRGLFSRVSGPSLMNEKNSQLLIILVEGFHELDQRGHILRP